MFVLNDIWDEGKKIIGICSDEIALRTFSDALVMIASQLEPEALRAELDIMTCGCSCADGSTCLKSCCGKQCITMPREVETIIAINIGCNPALGYGELFSFHQNAGNQCCKSDCGYSWFDQGGWHSTHRDIITPANLVVFTSTADDDGRQFIVYGYDEHGDILRHQVNGEWKNGILIPTIFGYAIPDSEQPKVARITGIFKETSIGSMRLSTTDDSGATGVLLGIYEFDENVPQYRRVKLSRACKTVRVAYKKRSITFSSRSDHVPLRSRLAFIMAIISRKFYREFDFANAHSAEADAIRMELNAQMSAEPPTYSPPQIIDIGNSIRDKSDWQIV